MDIKQLLKNAIAKRDAVERKRQRLLDIRTDLASAKGENREGAALADMVRSNAIPDVDRAEHVLAQVERDERASAKKIAHIEKRMSHRK